MGFFRLFTASLLTHAKEQWSEQLSEASAKHAVVVVGGEVVR